MIGGLIDGFTGRLDFRKQMTDFTLVFGMRLWFHVALSILSGCVDPICEECLIATRFRQFISRDP